MLEIKDLKKSFDGRQILNGVDLTVEDGEILSIVGAIRGREDDPVALHHRVGLPTVGPF